MKIKTNENGYTLLLTIGIVVLFAVLGLSLITITNAGIIKNESRQNNVLATDLSQKGIDYAIEDIQALLNNEFSKKSTENSGKGVTAAQFKTILEEQLDTLKDPTCANPITIGSAPQKTVICIKNVEMLSNAEKDRFKRKITFESQGISNGKNFITTSTIIFGTDSIPEQLRYAVSSNEGDLYFHGGVEVTGDIRSAKNVHISKKAFSSWTSSPDWHNSIPLTLKPTYGNNMAKIIVPTDKNYINYYENSLSKKSDHNNANSNDIKYSAIKYVSPQATFYPKDVANLKKKLTNSQNLTITTKELASDTLDVSNILQEKIKKKPENVHESSKFSSDSLLNKTENSNSLYYYEWEKCESKKCTSEIEKTTVEIMGTTSKQKNVTIQGTHYIYGDLKIHYADVKSNAILYVDGDVEIRFSELKKLNDGSLIIFATGEIFIANISANEDTPSEISGFFYSNKNMTIYGVGSNIKISGGLSAKNIFLTGIRGSVKTYGMDIPTNVQEKSPSRLRIEYDENIINQYTQFKRNEEDIFITDINEPLLLERK